MTSKTLSDGPWDQLYPLHFGAREGKMDLVRLYLEVKNFAADEADGEFLKCVGVWSTSHDSRFAPFCQKSRFFAVANKE